MLPRIIETQEQLEEILSRPTPEVCDAIAGLDGDLLLLGVGGKMGPTIARLARRAIDEAGIDKRVIGVSRFSDADLRSRLDGIGVETIACDLLEPGTLDALPDVGNVVYLAGMKFGTTGAESMTWSMNVHLPGLVAQRYCDARIVALSTGNVYPFTPVSSGGPTEAHVVAPVGEYAQSCLGRERLFQYGSERCGTSVVLIRLNYAIDLRYGVLLDVAQRVYVGTPIDLRMGYVNLIWQHDANVAILRAFALCAQPPAILNLTGPDTVSVRDLAHHFGRCFGVEPAFEGKEAETALLSNAAKYVDLFGPPAVSLEQMIEWVAHWVRIGGPTLGKPTHFDARDGKF